MSVIAAVCLEKTTYSFDMEFDYVVPDNLIEKAKAGCRVLVPFGAGNVQRQGMILSVRECQASDKLKQIVAVQDEMPLLNEELLKMIPWLKDRYFCTLYDACRLLLPTGIGIKTKVCYLLSCEYDDIPHTELTFSERQIIDYVSNKKRGAEEDKLLEDMCLTSNDMLLELVKRGILKKQHKSKRVVGDATQKMVRLTSEIPDKKLTARQLEVFEILESAGEVSVKEICYFTGVNKSVVDTMVKNGFAEYFEEEIYRTPLTHNKTAEKTDIVLSDVQQKAFDELTELYKSPSPNVALLYGVTGSGKTLVFMKLIDEAMKTGDGIIVMVPEISLVPQVINRFRDRYGDKLAVFHSGLSLGERLDEWKRVRNGKAQIVIGTRSAVFAPFEKIGLIIIDEEQESTYKSEMNPRYHAREVSKFRCAYHNALLVLSSATPSIESAYMALQKKYSLVTLPERYGDATLPEVIVSDMNVEEKAESSALFGLTLTDNIAANLANGEQSILLLNRRGYYPFASCTSCGEVVCCPNCSISLAYHSANNRLVCHYCGYSMKYSHKCPNCEEEKLSFKGIGTQRAEEKLAEMFPDARILRMDTDSMMNKGAYEKKLSAFDRGEYDIMIGTQMVAKGLDFPNVTMVGVISADQSLYSSDFRSSERTFDLLAQVVGRAGRGNKKGRAIIQTYTPENNIIALASMQNYGKFYKQEIAYRKAMLYPPFSDIVVVGFVSENEDSVRLCAEEYTARLTKTAREGYKDLPLRILDPSPALVFKISNRFRYRVILKCKNNRRLREMLSAVLIESLKNSKYKDVNIYYDMTPDII